MAIIRRDLNIIVDALLPILGSPGTAATEDAWNVATEYAVDDLVIHNGAIYRCILLHTGEEPPSSTQWEIVSIRRLRGKITFDSKDLRLPAPAVADGLLIGSAFGIPIFRSAALADDVYEYRNKAGTLISTNA